MHDLWYLFVRAIMNTGGQRAEQDRLVVRILSARELSVLLRKGENMEIIGRYSGPCSNAPVDQQDSACWLANRLVGYRAGLPLSARKDTLSGKRPGLSNSRPIG